MMVFAPKFLLPAAEAGAGADGSLPSQHRSSLFQLYELAEREGMVQIFLNFGFKSHVQNQKYLGNILKKDNILISNTGVQITTQEINCMRNLFLKQTNEISEDPHPSGPCLIGVFSIGDTCKLGQILVQVSRYYIWLQVGLSYVPFMFLRQLLLQHILITVTLNSWVCVICQ